MAKNYRLRTTPGIDKDIRIKIDQDFDFIEILSLKLKQSEVYTRFCADYGVVAGRVITNGGYGIPNVTISLFVPLLPEDETDSVISTLYPYKKLTDKNEDGYRYNLLPYVQEYGGHNPTGTFPDREDVLTRSEVLEVYEKYYKYTVRTNESGDFMIVGVPLGQQTLVMDMDVSNIGCFSLRPSDLVRMGMGTESQFEGSSFKSSTDLDSLPQIVNQKKEIEVSSFWGEEDLCSVGITRADFDLRDLGIQIEPQAIFMGSMFSTTDEDALQSNCKPKFDTGNLCDLITAPGTILAIRQTIYTDTSGFPILEQYKLPEGGNIIDSDGTWLIEMPMNLDYITTNEFGEQVISNDPTIGVPTKAKYRFKIQYQNEGFAASTQRADYLVPNIREYGWDSNLNADGPANDLLQKQSYAFSLDWSDYGNTGTTIGLKMISDAINCEDKFFEFNYNRVYTVSNFIDRWKWGFNRSRHLGIKEITNRDCSTTTNRMPVNDGVRNFDLIFFLFNLTITIFTPLIYVFIPLMHVMAKFWPISKWALAIGLPILFGYLSVFFVAAAIGAFPAIGLMIISAVTAIIFGLATAFFIIKVSPLIADSSELKGLSLPSMAYPDCEACSCEPQSLDLEQIVGDGTTGTLSVITINDNKIYTRKNSSFLCDVNSNTFWGNTPNESLCGGDNENECNNNGDFCQQRTNPYAGGANTRSQRYTLNGYGIKYAIAGYPNGLSQGTPINRCFWKPGQIIIQRDITYSQRLNLANIRQRYFDPSEYSNVITTTVDNDGYPSDPFTDNMVVLLCDQNTLDNLPAGSLISFNNPDNVNDNNVNGYNVSGVTENQFGNSSITGTSSLFTTVVQNYIKSDATSGVANLTITGSTTGRTYNYKGGMEYFQVVTGMTVGQSEIHTSSSPNINYMRFYFLQARQNIYYRKSCGNEPAVPELINPLQVNGSEYKNLNVMFLVRGVDPFTEKQVIKYDISKLFGKPSGTHVVRGKYHLNIPIQENSGNPIADWWINKKTPESHEVGYPYSKLYHKPFNFRPDPNLYTGFTTNTIKYYSSLDKKSIANGGYKVSSSDVYNCEDNDPVISYSLASANTLFVRNFNTNTPNNPWTNTGLSDYNNDSQTNKYRIRFIGNGGGDSSTYQGNVEGGSFMFMDIEDNKTWTKLDLGNEGTVNTFLNGNCPGVPGPIKKDRRPRLFAPSYQQTNPNLSVNITFDQTVNNARMIIRSDRLPTSDTAQENFNNRYALYQNDNFTIYRILENGETQQLGGPQPDTTGNAQDYEDDANSGSTSVLSTFSCEGMVPLPCYSGYGENFGVKTPCAENENPTRITNGCYKLIQKPYLKANAIDRDFKNFLEWKTRFRFMFGACRGIISHVFQNNWVNGSLYSFAFKKKTIFDSNDNPSKYVFCGSKDVNLVPQRPNQGPVYLNNSTNTFYYRSTPYVLTQTGNNVNGYFIGQQPRIDNLLGGWGPAKNYFGKGLNQRNLHFPTTIMDLGPRDQFAKEICLNPQLENYLVETIQSTSFNDTSDLLLLFIVSRLVNSGSWGQLVNLGDSSINQLFSRSDGRIDGDIAQLFSINSEYGILPFNEQFYGNDDIVLGSANEVFLGVLFSATTQNRIALTPGTATFGNIQQLIGYPKTQTVPMYNWFISNDQGNPTINPSTIFGTQYNDWLTDTPLDNPKRMYSIPYQEMSFNGADYFQATNGPSTGYIMNYDITGQRDSSWGNPSNQNKANFVVGAPYHFYFGLGKGKTSLNRFITKYIIGTE